MLQSTARYPVLKVDATGDRVVSHAGSVLLTRTADVVGLGAALSAVTSQPSTRTGAMRFSTQPAPEMTSQCTSTRDDPGLRSEF